MAVNPDPDERLAILRNSDPSRKWSSLDDTRVCVLCGKTITGRQVAFHSLGDGHYRLGCPTRACPSTVRDWFYLGSSLAPRRTAVRRVEVSFFSPSAGSGPDGE